MRLKDAISDPTSGVVPPTGGGVIGEAVDTTKAVYSFMNKKRRGGSLKTLIWVVIIGVILVSMSYYQH